MTGQSAATIPTASPVQINKVSIVAAVQDLIILIPTAQAGLLENAQAFMEFSLEPTTT